MRRVGVVMAAAIMVAGCSTGSGPKSSSGTVTGSGSPAAAADAAKACRMWAETLSKASASKTPNYKALTAMAQAVGTVANQAADADARWNQLALDVAPATDFQSAAMTNQNENIIKDCQAVPRSANKTELTHPDPFSTTSTTSP